MYRSRSRPVLVWAIPSVLLSLALAAPAAAQTRPSASEFEGLRCFATVMPSVATTTALVTGTRDPGKQIFGKGDALYLQVRPGASLAPDQVYDIYRVEGQIEHPRSGRDIGDVIVLVGSVRIVDAGGDRAMARVEDACGEIEVGDRIHPTIGGEIATPPEMPPFSADRLVTPRESDATVVYGSSESLADPDDLGERHSMSVRGVYAAGDVVTVDRGSVHGWTPGVRVFFYEPDPGLTADREGAGEPVVVAQGYVIWTASDTAAVLVTDGDRAVEVGSRARPLEGS